MHTGQKYFWRSGVVWRVLAAVCWLLAASPVSLPTSLALAGRQPSAPHLLETGPVFSFPAGSNPTSLVYGPQGSFWSTLPGSNTIASLILPGTVLTATIPTPQALPYDLIIGPDRALWFSEQHAGQIGRYHPGTATFSEFLLLHANGSPARLALGQEGNLWFTEVDGNRIGRVTPQGVVTEYDLPHPASTPIGFATALDGSLWFTERNGHRIGRIIPGNWQLDLTEYDTDPLRRPTEIILGPDGNLWFIYEIGPRLVRVDPATGGMTTYILPTASTSLLDLAIGPDGRLWFLGAQTVGSFAVTPGGPDDLHEAKVAPNVFEGEGNSRLIAGPGADMFYITSNTQNVYTATVEGGATLRDLQLFLTGLSPVALAAGEFYLNAQVQNWSDSPASGVEISLTLDSDIQFVNLETPGGPAACLQVGAAPPQVACDLGSLPGAQSLPLTVTLQTTRIAGNAAGRSLALRVMPAEGDYLPANNRITRGIKLLTSIDYFNDFSHGNDAHWSHANTSNPLGDLIYLGTFSDDRVTFTFADLPPHNQAWLCFDLYVLGPWDGSSLVDPNSNVSPPPVIGPDLWAFYVNDNRQLSTSFSNNPGLEQAYTANYLEGVFPAHTGAVAIGDFDANPNALDTRYHLCTRLEHTAQDFIATFYGLNLDDLENWALDNVSLKIYYDAAFDWIHLPLIIR
jgi:virginiamycin B lyase